MKIAILGAGGVRTPLIVEAMARRQPELGLTEVALMDIDDGRLEVMRALLEEPAGLVPLPFRSLWTADPALALAGADFVITTFRVGGIASRIVDERVPLGQGVLGQETTGPGGFAMAMRSIPVLLSYLDLMRVLCPSAWLVNFANPAGLLAEAAIRVGRWRRTVGICDAPGVVAQVAAAVLGLPKREIDLDYFGLNHLGWTRGVWHDGENRLPQLMDMLRTAGSLPGQPFSAALVLGLGMIPNEYLYYYYHSREAVEKILKGDLTRGERISHWNEALFRELNTLRHAADYAGMRRLHKAYLENRGETYMAAETGGGGLARHLGSNLVHDLATEGYAGIALDAIESLAGGSERRMVLNVPNRGAIDGMGPDDVVEVPTSVVSDSIRPLRVDPVPHGPLGLMLQVKAYERLTIEAAVEGSRRKALEALTIHPLVRDYRLAEILLDGFCRAHGALFPQLN